MEAQANLIHDDLQLGLGSASLQWMRSWPSMVLKHVAMDVTVTNA